METPRAQVGDLIDIHRHRLSELGHTGEIREVIGAGEHEHYRVRWEDGHESIFTPGSDAVIRKARRASSGPLAGRGDG
jgi:hypothetical protein